MSPFDALHGDLLCISCSFRPETSPTANRAAKLVDGLASRGWRVRVVTEAAAAGVREVAGIERVVASAVTWRGALRVASRLRLNKLLELAVWPDPDIVWAPAALMAALASLRERKADVVLVFMMPYSAGLVGLALKAVTGLPLVLNFDDSPTCTDMHPSFVTAFHRWLAGRLEELYISRADAAVYVSETTRARVASRIPEQQRGKLRLIRYGADPVPGVASVRGETFTIRYIGGMNGWYALLNGDPAPWARRLYRKAMTFGVVHEAPIDHRGSSPVFVARAVKRVLARHPEWRDRIHVEVYGNHFPVQVVEAALARHRVKDVVTVHGKVSHDEAVRLTGSAEMLFLTLPARLDQSPGGRISAKTYEYLTTDRPIVAALPPGENREFLEGHAGVACCDPFDEDAMERAVERAATAYFSGRPERFDRRALLRSLSYAARTEELERLLEEVAGRSREGRAVPSDRLEPWTAHG